jgi:hypothetical protein
MPEVKEIYESITRQAPSRPDGFERMLRRRDRKRRNQRITAGVVGMAVFVAAVWLVTTGGPLDRTRTPVAPGGSVTGPATSGPADPTDAEKVGFVGLPPVGTAPSEPAKGELVLHFYGGTTSGPRTEMWTYTDGRLIWRQEFAGLPYGANPQFTGYLEQHLTPEGVEALRSEVLSTGLFERDLDLKVQVGPCLNQIEVRTGGRLVGLTYSRDCEGRGTTPATPEQVDAILRLDGLLGDPGSWLPASAWEDREIAAYVPSRFAVCFGPKYPADEPIGANRLLALFPPAAEDLLGAIDRIEVTGLFLDPSLGFSEPTPIDSFCSEVATEEARVLADAFEEAGYVRDDTWVLSYELVVPEPVGTVRIEFEPIFPHGGWTCSACG